MRQTLGLLCLALLSLPASAGSKKRKGEGPRGMLAPDLSKVLGDGWLVPPELSDRAQPGAILDLSPGGLRVGCDGCVAGFRVRVGCETPGLFCVARGVVCPPWVEIGV